jgi:isocitrate dehydrogenase kinase/phosphatase
VRDGFDRHYALFRDCARAAKTYFEAGDWRAIRQVGGDRIDYYDRRVEEAVERIEREYRSAGLEADALWERVKLHFIGLLIDHKQPECAETFFNSVSCKILHRTYFHNRFIFVRPAVSTEHIEADPPRTGAITRRPTACATRSSTSCSTTRCARASPTSAATSAICCARSGSARPRPYRPEANHQIQMLSSLFYSRSHGVRRRSRGQRDEQRAVRGRAQARRSRAACTWTRS